MPKRSRKSITRSTNRRSAGSVLRRRTGSSELRRPGSVVSTDMDEVLLPHLARGAVPDLFRHGQYLHVSDLLTKCMRMVALAERTNTRLTGGSTWQSQQLVYALGHAVEDFVRSKVIQNAPEKVYGGWSCHCGSLEIEGTAQDAGECGVCKVCGGKPAKYVEMLLRNDTLKVIGSVDLVFMFQRAFYLFEIKSMKKDQWSELVRPLPYHILQVVFYWWLAKELGWPLHNQVSILYVCKTFVFAAPYKEFIVKPEDHLHRLDDYKEDAESLAAALNGGPLPYRVCPEPTSPQAKKCDMCSICFSLPDK